MKARRDLISGFFLAVILLSMWFLFGPSTALAANENCANGQSAPCAEDVQVSGCFACHSILLAGGNRNGTDRQITASLGTDRHILDPKQADWTSTVQTMVNKGAQVPVSVTVTAGYLNTNYCTGCTGPILGSPVVSSITQTGATITWSTSGNGFEDAPTDTVLYYGTNQADVLLGDSCSSCTKIVLDAATPVAHHVVNLTGLSSFTQYYVVNKASSATLGTRTSTYTIKFLTSRGSGGGGGGGGECTGGVDAIPSRVYLSNNPSLTSTDTPRVVVIDPVTNTQIDSIEVSGGTPGELASHPDGSTLYATAGSNLSVIDTLGNVELTSLLGVGDLFNQVVVSPDGHKLYLLYRRVSGTATLILKVFDLSIDPTAPTLTTTISNPIFDGCYGPLGLGVRPDGSKLYLACRPTATNLPDRFYVVDTATNTPTQTATFTRDSSNYTFINAMAVKPDGTRVYLARTNSNGSTVQMFDAATGASIGSIPLPSNALPRAAVMKPDGSKLFVVDQSLGTHVIDTATNSLTSTMPKTKSRGLDIAITPDGVHVYTTLVGSVFVLDSTADAPVATITGDFNSAYQITVSPGRAGVPPVCTPPSGSGPVPSRVYLSNNASGTSGDTDRVIVIDPVTNTQIDSIPASGTPGELAPHPDGTTLYVTEDSRLSVIDVGSNVEITSLTGVGDLFDQIVVSPNGQKLYLLYRRSSGTATLILKVFDLSVDPTAPTLTTTVSNPIFDGCYGPLGLGVRPDGSKLYLACRPNDSSLPDRFYVVDTATNTPTQTATFTRDSSNYTFINAMAVKPDGTRVYLARAVSSGVSTVEMFDASTGTRIGSIPLPADALPRAAVLKPDGSRLFVVDQALGTHVIDTGTNTLITTMPKTKSRGLDIAITPNGADLYATLLSTVFVLDATANAWLTTITGDFSSAYQVTVTPGHP